MKYKVGDKVRVRKDLEVGKHYGKLELLRPMITNEIMTVIGITEYGNVRLKNCYAYTEEMLEPAVDDIENKSNNVLDLERYIIKEDACIVFWKDGSKTIVKKMAKAKHNKELAFLTAYFQKHSGLSKSKANKFLENLEETIKKERK